MVLTESMVLCLWGGLTGTLAALLVLGLGGFAIGAEGATIAFEPSWWLAVKGGIVSLGIGLVAGLSPAIQAGTVSIVRALRAN